MNWTVGRKMLLIGIVIVFSLGVLTINAYWSNSTIAKRWDAANLRTRQVDIAYGMLLANTEMVLAAMDSLIDKDEGRINDERMALINGRAEFMSKHMDQLLDTADTNEEKGAVSLIQDTSPKLVEIIRQDLPRLIEKSAGKFKQIEESFVKIDDTLDELGDGITENLAEIFASVQKEQEESSNLLMLRNEQMDLLTRLMSAHSLLMLNAMDAIVDKDEGTIAKERMESINSSIALIERHMNDLAELADTEDELKAAAHMRQVFPELAKGTRQELAALIEGRAKKEDFDRIDDKLDQLGETISEDLNQIFSSVKREQEQALKLSILRNQQMVLVNNLIRSQSDLMLAAMDSIIDKEDGRINPARMEIINSRISFITDHLDDLIELADTEQEKTAAGNIRASFPRLAGQIQSDLRILIEEGAVQARSIRADFVQMDDTIDELAEPIKKSLATIVASIHKEQEDSSVILSSGISLASRVNWITFLAALGIFVPLFLLMSRSITKPLKEILEGLRGGSEQMAGASKNVSSASQQLAEGASEQAAAIEQTSSSIEEMASMTGQNADSAGQANRLMLEAGRIVERSNHSMTRLTASMREISRASEETQKIIKTIDEVAFQTNLLALNAAVEAARAGEAGAGFAVVADEVRNLALRAAEAAKNTADLIESTVKKINEGVVSVEQANQEFHQVTSIVTKSGDLIEEIAAASQEQAQGISQINQAVAEMDKVIQRNAANAEESAAASEEMSAQAEQLKGFVFQLVDLVGTEAKGEVEERGEPSLTRFHAKSISRPSRTILVNEKKGNGKDRVEAIKISGATEAKERPPYGLIPLDDEF